MWRSEDGITLVEVLVTLLIIGILASIAVLNFGQTRTSSIQNACKTNYEAILLAISTYQSDNNGGLPANLAALSPTYINPSLVTTDTFALTLEVTGGSYVIKVNKAGSVLGNAPSACAALT